MDDIFAFCNHVAWQVGGTVLVYDSAWGVVAYSTLNQALDEVRRSIAASYMGTAPLEAGVVTIAPRNLERADQAIAMATMFLSEHIGVRAIVAMTESGGTARFLSRFRSSAPIYAFSRHDGARRKMAMIRDVFPIAFDSRGLAPREAARDAMRVLHDRELLAEGDRVIFTSGDHMEQHGATNTLRLLQVGPGGLARALRSIPVYADFAAAPPWSARSSSAAARLAVSSTLGMFSIMADRVI